MLDGGLEGGNRGPRNCLKTVPLLGETLDALRTRRTAFQPLRFSGLQVVQSRWPWYFCLAGFAFIAGRDLSILSTHMASKASTITLPFLQLLL